MSKKSEAEIGNLVESETSISLQVQYGAVEYKKNTLLWYSMQRDIDSFFKAGQKAAADGNPPAAKILFELSIEREPATADQARAKLEILSKEPTVAVAPASATTQPGNFTDALSPEDKISRGQQMIEDGKQLLQQQTISSTSNADAAKQRITDGEKLVAQGQKELAEIRVSKPAEESQKQVAVKDIEETIAAPSAMTREEKLANLGLAAGLALVALFALWQITMKEPK